MINEQSFQDLYGYFFGMINRGDLDELYARALEAIPAIVSLEDINKLKTTASVGSANP
ncbi:MULTISPECIES: hypothetical protein [Lacrimispora]|jgi:cystathionine beta-lyase family protein involved in aluminum resistance|uniref:hypothetical protein n=1 Tax=Lacrimispora TaxID=2719231 RepID=UPI00140E6E7F|nr:hypothetical protein [Lacrimispora amygdalina]MDK2964474.1 hypothetical protein [Lacrimispora sp.]